MPEGEVRLLEVELTTAYRCDECDKVSDEEEANEGGQVYECGNCGTRFNRSGSANDNHQCPDCNKFGAKCEDGEQGKSCPDCMGTVTEVEVFACPCPECSSHHTEEEWQPTGEG